MKQLTNLFRNALIGATVDELTKTISNPSLPEGMRSLAQRELDRRAVATMMQLVPQA